MHLVLRWPLALVKTRTGMSCCWKLGLIIRISPIHQLIYGTAITTASSIMIGGSNIHLPSDAQVSLCREEGSLEGQVPLTRASFCAVSPKIMTTGPTEVTQNGDGTTY